MKKLIVLPIFVIAFVRALTAATAFEDSFESGQLGPPWSVSKTFDGRAMVTTDYGPASGSAHLVLDDAANDATFSAIEVTLTLDLSNKKNVVLNFKAKSLGNEPHAAPTGNFMSQRNYDGVAISTDGGTTWRTVQSVEAVPSAWTNYAIALDSSVASLGGSFGAGFRIRFSEYGKSPAPTDGIAFDDVSITADDDQRSTIELPASVLEATNSYTGIVHLAFAPSVPLALHFSATSTDLLLPALVTVPSGQTYVSFVFGVRKDSLINLPRPVTVRALGADVTPVPATTSIIDVPVVTFTLPSQLPEGAVPANNARITLDRRTNSPLTVKLIASPEGELNLPATVTIPFFQSSVTFTARAVDDAKIDGNVPVTVTANSVGLFSASETTTTVDNEPRTLGLTLPATLPEGSAGTGTVTISGPLDSPLEVTLASSNPAPLGLPLSITIPAGSTSTSFVITGVDNLVRDGTRTPSVTASAATFTSATKSVIVRDNEIVSYSLVGTSEIVNLSGPLAITIQAFDVEGNVIGNASGTVNVDVVLPDGTAQPLTPATAMLSGTGWSGSVSIPTSANGPLRLRVTDATDVTTTTSAFDIMRTLTLPAGDLIWDAARSRLYASVPSTAGGSYANKIIAIDPVTLQIMASVTTGQNPGQLALTSGGEVLYVVLNATGRIAKIDPATFTVTLTYPVGSDPQYGTLYARDIFPLAGQPNALLVSRQRQFVSPAGMGLAVFDDGVARPAKTNGYLWSTTLIEPSASPSLFFAYNMESTGFEFHRGRVDANGVSILNSRAGVLDGFFLDMRSEGDRVYSSTGAVIDGAQAIRLGSFGTSGPVCPDFASHRVFFLDQMSYPTSSCDQISAWDPATLALLCRLRLPFAVESPSDFIRWGATGLAFRDSSTIYLVSSRRLVPCESPANLSVAIQTNENPATAQAPLTWMAQITNRGPNVARSTVASIILSSGQAPPTLVTDTGTAVASNLTTTWAVGDLAVGGTATCTLTAIPQAAGLLTGSIAVTSYALDEDNSDNAVTRAVGVGYPQVVDVVDALQLTATNLLVDATRNVLWVAIPSKITDPGGKSVLSIDPKTGRTSDLIALDGDPRPRAFALSKNGRYLYVGIDDMTEVQRIDLSSSPPTSLRIQLSSTYAGFTNYAYDLEVLDGDGTSFLMAGSDGRAVVYDGAVPRPMLSYASQIERTATPNTFISQFSAGAARLTVIAGGVSIEQYVTGLLSGYEMTGSGNKVLTYDGNLVDSSVLSRIANFGTLGSPCLESDFQRAYHVKGAAVRGFDTGTGQPIASLALPTTQTGLWALKCVRWGLDGIAVLGSDRLYIARWSSIIPPNLDLNHDHLSDAWEATYFGTLQVDPAVDSDGDGVCNGLEYLFATRPDLATRSPVQFSNAPSSVTNGGKTLHLVFPRRSGVDRSLYRYEFSTDLMQWDPQPAVVETVLSTQTVGGETVETVDASFECAPNTSAFARLRWIGS